MRRMLTGSRVPLAKSRSGLIDSDAKLRRRPRCVTQGTRQSGDIVGAHHVAARRAYDRHVGLTEALNEVESTFAGYLRASPVGRKSEQLGGLDILAHQVIEMSSHQGVDHYVVASTRLHNDRTASVAS